MSFKLSNLTSDQRFRIFTGVLLFISIAWSILVFSISSAPPSAIAAPVMIGNIISGFILQYRWKKYPHDWLGRINVLQILLIAAAFIAGAEMLQHGFQMPGHSPGGEPVTRFGANIVNGKCLVQYNMEQPVISPLSVCKKYEYENSMEFCGVILLFSSIIHFGALKYNEIDARFPYTRRSLFGFIR